MIWEEKLLNKKEDKIFNKLIIIIISKLNKLIILIKGGIKLIINKGS
jgi:hypothetical protein